MTKKKKSSKKSSQAKVYPIKKGDPQAVVEASKPQATINTAVEAVKEYAIQLKGRAEEGKVRGVLVIEWAVDPKDSGLRQAGAVSGQEAAFSSLMIQKMVMDGAKKED